MFIVVTPGGTTFSSFDLEQALRTAVDDVSAGISGHAQVFDYETSALFYDVEADTKVDEAEKYYPAIVHRRR